MEIKKKHIYRGIGGFLAAITLTTSVLPAFAFDAPIPADRKSP